MSGLVEGGVGNRFVSKLNFNVFTLQQPLPSFLHCPRLNPLHVGLSISDVASNPCNLVVENARKFSSDEMLS
jgi:hypothetical protein